MKKIHYLALAALLLAGCTTMSDMQAAPAEMGVSKTFTAGYEQVKGAALASVQSLNVSVQSSTEKNGVYQVYFTKSLSAFSWGELGRVTVKATADGSGTIVYVYSQKRATHQVTGVEQDEFAQSVFKGIDEALAKKP